jgi:hypothetical protein
MLRLFLGAAAVLGWAFDASVVLRRARRGPWRAEVAERSMAPALLPGDWLLLDPTGGRWPRRGTIVVIREPGTGILAIKRVAARGRRAGGPSPAAVDPGHAAGGASAAAGEPAASAPAGAGRPIDPREAWLLGDAPGDSIDSRTYGPLDADAYVGRAWFRYGPPGRIGPLRRRR